MKIQSIFIGFLAVVGSSSVALADISGGPVFAGGGRQASVRCMVYNAGPGAATITNQVITTGGSPVVLNVNSCGPTLAAGKLCVIAANVTGVAHSCKFVTTGGVLRGVVAVYSSSDAMLHSSDMW